MPQLREWSRDDTRRLVRAPRPDDDKYRRGAVALCTGSDAYPGAAVLGVEGAWRAGAGFVRHLGVRRVGDAVLARRPETVVELLPEGDDDESAGALPRASAWVVGSGMDASQRDPAATRVLRRILSGTVPVVVDAGALDLLTDASAPVLATPHDREFARLRDALGLRALAAGDGADEGRRADAVQETARALGGTLLLKGARTLVAGPDGPVTVVEAGTPWLATAGTGDVLAGVLGALLAAAPGASPADVAAAGAWIHGRAGRSASGTGPGAVGRPIVALDVAEAIPAVVEDLLT